MTLVSFYLLGAVGRFADRFTVGSIGLFVLGAVLLQPFVEEAYFRGVLFVALDEKLGSIGAVITTSLLFAAMHPLHRLTTLPMAFILGVAKVKMRSVAACFVLHATYNIGILFFELVYGG